MSSKTGPVAVLIALVITFAAPAGTAARAAMHTNVVVDWNHTMLAAFATANVPAPAANRLGGIVQAAVFDALNGIESHYTPIHVAPGAPPDASPRAAAASAAHTALVALFPLQKKALDDAFASSLAPLVDEDNESLINGIDWGKRVADQIIAWRAADGFAAPPPTYLFATVPGAWQPTPGGSGAPKFQQLATTVPFALTSPAQFRPGGPPPLDSALYTASFAEVKAIGGAVSTERSAWQTETARFWQLDTPVAMWDRVADDLSSARHLNLLRTARLLALVNIAIADATFSVWDAKVAFNFWRPVTAIAHADVDGNPETTADTTWSPLITTPYFQEYPSAHSGVSSAAAHVLAFVFGEGTEFTVTSAGLSGVTRSFASFADGVAQVGDARAFAGFHFRFSIDDAVALGRNVAGYVEAHSLTPLRDDDGTDSR